MTGFPSSLRLGRLGRERQRVLFLALAAVYTNPTMPSALRSLPDLRPSPQPSVSCLPALGWDFCFSLKSQLKATASVKPSLIAAAEMGQLLWTRWGPVCPESWIHFILLRVRIGR